MKPTSKSNAIMDQSSTSNLMPSFKSSESVPWPLKQRDNVSISLKVSTGPLPSSLFADGSNPSAISTMHALEEEPLFSALALGDAICEDAVEMPKELTPVIEQLKKWRVKNNLSQAQAIKVFRAASLPITLDALQNWEV